MLSLNPFSRAPLHEHTDPAQRIAGIAELPADSPLLASLLAGDPVPEVRAAAARRAVDAALLASAWAGEADPVVKAAIAGSLRGTPHFTDAMRAEVVRTGIDRSLIGEICDERALIDLALHADHADTRRAAAERVTGVESLRELAEAARHKDRGVARAARERLEAIERREKHRGEADAIIGRLGALADASGPIIDELVELDRRWSALDLGEDAERHARHAAAHRVLEERFGQEHTAQRERALAERRRKDWLASLAQPDSDEAMVAARARLAELRNEAGESATALAELAEAETRLDGFAAALRARAEEAARNADAGKLAEILAAQQQAAAAARQRVHALLHTAEQALAAGELKAARESANEIKPVRLAAGMLPKPTVQRISQLMQKLADMERWETFGQQSARTQLCERAEALASQIQALDAATVAKEVKKLRDEWKGLDQLAVGGIKVPQVLWNRFDGACTKAYAPAARYFSERAAQRKQARDQRGEFIAQAVAHAPTLLAAEPRDWRAIERYLRETDQKWRDGTLGSLEPAAWAKLDGEFAAVLKPLRDALGEHRRGGKSAREALIAEAKAIAADTNARDTIDRIKTVQARWQTVAKENPIGQRDERALWDQFRAACDAVFAARKAERKKVDEKKTEGLRALEAVIDGFEALAKSDKSEHDIRKESRELENQWAQAKRGVRAGDPALGRLEGRLRKARAAADDRLAAQAHARQAAVWETLDRKERLCESIERAVLAGAGDAEAFERDWGALPVLAGGWEKKLLARRDAGLKALRDAVALPAHVARIREGGAKRRAALLELELALGIDPPPAVQAARRALQLQQLKDRFSGAAQPAVNNASPADRLVGWCAESGLPDGDDDVRREKVFQAIARRRPG